MRQRNPGRGGHGGECRHSGDDVERDAGCGQRQRLLAAAAVDEGIAALETHDVEPRAAELDEQRVDLVLRQARTADDERLVGRLGDELRRDEAVVDEHVACAHALEPLHRDEAGIARAGADEGDGHPRALATASRKKSRRSSYVG